MLMIHLYLSLMIDKDYKKAEIVLVKETDDRETKFINS